MQKGATMLAGLSSMFPTLAIFDLIAVVATLVIWVVIGWWIEHPTTRNPSVSRLMQTYRRAWMRAFIGRNPRIFDAQILGNLRQSTAFFASTNFLAIGGALALAGNAGQLQGLTQSFPGSGGETVLQTKMLLVLFFLTNGFLKFVWTNRLFSYCAVVMAAVPNEVDDPKAVLWADKAAEINIRAAMNFNKGLRSTYFALASLAWLLGPITLILAAVVTFGVLWQREFSSQSRSILSEGTNVHRASE